MKKIKDVPVFLLISLAVGWLSLCLVVGFFAADAGHWVLHQWGPLSAP